MSCPSHGERIARHNRLRDAIFHAAVSAHLSPTREDRGLIPEAEGSRPAYVYIPLWGPGARDVALDVCCVSPLQQATLERAAREPGYALAMRKAQKDAKYAEACRANNIEFIAMSVETTGAWEDGAARVLTRLAKALARTSGQEEGEGVRHLFGKLSILLMRANASMVLNRVAHHLEPNVNGDM